MPQTDTQPPPNDASVSQIPNLLLKTPRLLRVIIPVRQQTAVCEEATIFQAPRVWWLLLGLVTPLLADGKRDCQQVDTEATQPLTI